MVVSFNTQALSGLCSEDQLELLDSIDRLRLQGLDEYLSLPQIIVCGDQSSGKSSVLEAISGVPFPVKSNICTRFPTELVLRRTARTGVSVSIVPHSSLGPSEQSRISGFHERLDSFDGFPALIEKAKAAMGISTLGKAFSKDMLKVEISGPNRPHLTIVDLPGLIHSETKQQSASDVELVQEVVTAYMKQARSIMLAVISAKNDFANQIVLKLVRQADPSGNRTMGVITKPDTLVPGSDSEQMYVSLAENFEIGFRLGWHVLKNMDSDVAQEEAQRLGERDAEESKFFEQGVWSRLDPSMLGVDELRPKLSNVLIRQIARELPSLITEIDSSIKLCRKQIAALGVPRNTTEEQRLELLTISQRFQAIIKSSVDGTYNDPFFENAKTDKGYQQRIRAVLQNMSASFSETLRSRGHLRTIQNDDARETFTETRKGWPIPIKREDFITHTKSLLRRTKARELPNLFNPMVVADLFHEQSTRWESIVNDHVALAWKSAKKFLELLVHAICDPNIAKAILPELFEPELEKLMKGAQAKTAELLYAHRSVHPITYTKEYSETILQMWDDRRQEECAEVVKDFFGTSELEPTYLEGDYDLVSLVKLLSERKEYDIERIAASEALDCMHAYYTVAMKRFSDDVSVEVIEEKLLSVLGDILSPVKVFRMSTEEVAMIAGEPRDIRARRKKLTKQLDVLKSGSETCKRFVGVRLGDDSSDFSEGEEYEHEDWDDEKNEDVATPEEEPLAAEEQAE
ncbi:dynamin family protein [Xylariaceae sp. FL0255]|nr:dynamin family protein [Xylariaceae sp. FL0255]